jgi:hypothetical protein
MAALGALDRRLRSGSSADGNHGDGSRSGAHVEVNRPLSFADGAAPIRLHIRVQSPFGMPPPAGDLLAGWTGGHESAVLDAQVGVLARCPLVTSQSTNRAGHSGRAGLSLVPLRPLKAGGTPRTNGPAVPGRPRGPRVPCRATRACFVSLEAGTDPFLRRCPSISFVPAAVAPAASTIVTSAVLTIVFMLSS